MASSDAHTSLPPLPLPPGISENYVPCPSTGLTFHTIEAGRASDHQKPLVLLCHGYPELAFSWRKVMLPLAEAGYYVVAFDHRGYGRTSSFVDTSFALTNVVRDAVALVRALGYQQVDCIVGHDFGAVTASMSALMHPELFKSVVMMSHPFKAPSNDDTAGDIQKALAQLPEPRKHYKWYNSTSEAAGHWINPPQGLHAFLRGYLHVKSADWKANTPHPLDGWTAEQLAKMPHYYILPLDKSMPEAIADMMVGEDASVTKRWMSDQDLDVYVQEWSRTGFQGGLNYYRTTTGPARIKDFAPWVGKKIECPSTFISGAHDWGNYQEPGAIESFPDSCADFRGSRFIQGAGHWPQQEQPEKVVDELLRFLKSL